MYVFTISTFVYTDYVLISSLVCFFPFKFYIRFSEFLFLVVCSTAGSFFAIIILYFSYAYNYFSFLYDLLYFIFLDYLDHEDGSSKLLRNVSSCLPIHTPLHMREYCNTLNPLNAKLNPICHLLALLGAHHILHVSWIRVNLRS